MMMINIDYKALEKAVNLVDEGVSARLDLSKNLKVYAVGENVIRIDIKKEVK
jgi:hypothetical protein